VAIQRDDDDDAARRNEREAALRKPVMAMEPSANTSAMLKLLFWGYAPSIIPRCVW